MKNATGSAAVETDHSHGQFINNNCIDVYLVFHAHYAHSIYRHTH